MTVGTVGWRREERWVRAAVMRSRAKGSMKSMFHESRWKEGIDGAGGAGGAGVMGVQVAVEGS